MAAMLLDDATPCWGRREAPICTDCARLQTPAEYAGGFPGMNLLVPGAHLEQSRGAQPQWFCAERRSAGAHRPAAVCDPQLPPVSAPAHIQAERTCP
jgi:hypothetical protein